MIALKCLVAVPAVVLCAVWADARPQSQAEPAAKSGAQIILGKVRDTYRNLSGYHFERVLSVQEASTDGTRANIAELTLILATRDAKLSPESLRSPAINLDRFRLGTKTKAGEMLQACDGRTCWSYSSQKNEYMTGNRFMDVNTSVGVSMLMAVHLFTFSMVDDGTVQDPKVVREEDIEVGGERRHCYVIEGEIPAAPLFGPGQSTKPPSPASLGAFGLLSGLTLQGLAEGGRAIRYSPWMDDAASGAGAPTRVTLWIDKNAHVIIRSTMSAQLYKRTFGTAQADKVAITVTDSFTTAAVEAPLETVFRFTPPEGATEIPNAASRRNKK